MIFQWSWRIRTACRKPCAEKIFFGKNLLSSIGTFPAGVGRFMESSIVAKDWCPFDAIQCSYWGKFLAVFKFVADTRFQLERKSSLEIIWRSRNNSSKLDFMEWTKNERGPHHQTWNELLSIGFHWKIINRKIEHSQIFPLLGAPTASLREKSIGSIGRNVSQSDMAGQEERLRVHGCFLSAIYWEYIFSLLFPLEGSTVGDFIGYFFGISRNKASTVFYDTALFLWLCLSLRLLIFSMKIMNR